MMTTRTKREITSASRRYMDALRALDAVPGLSAEETYDYGQPVPRYVTLCYREGYYNLYRASVSVVERGGVTHIEAGIPPATRSERIVCAALELAAGAVPRSGSDVGTSTLLGVNGDER